MATFLANINHNARAKLAKRGLGNERSPPQGQQEGRRPSKDIVAPEEKESGLTVEQQKQAATLERNGPTLNYHRAVRVGGKWKVERCFGSEGLQTLHDGNQSNIEWSESQQRYDGVTCANKYEETALMEDAPTGYFQDRGAIQFFWTTFLATKPGGIRYKNVRMRVLDKDNTTFSSDWTMNVCGGIIMLELWTRQPDNKWLLPEDRFHVKEMHNPPLTSTRDDDVRGLLPLYLIKEVSAECRDWLDRLNKQANLQAFSAVYSSDAVLDVDPLGTYRGRDQILAFWKKLLEKSKTGVLSYWNIKVVVIDDITVNLTADWYLNDLEGQITMQKWMKTKSGWRIVEDNMTVDDTEFQY